MQVLATRARPDVKPALAAQIAPAHPLAHKMLAFFALNGDCHTPQNAAMPDQKWVLQNTAPTFVDTPYGPSAKFDGSSKQAYIFAGAAGAGSPRDELQPASLPLSFAVAINFSSVSGSNQIWHSGINPVNGDIGGLFCSGFNTGFSIGYGTGVGSDSTNTRTIALSTALTTGTWYVISGSLRGATDMSIYLNGIDNNGTLGGTGASLGYPASGNATSSIGYAGSAAVGLNATIAWIAYWNRNLSADEHFWLAKRGPFDLFRRTTVPVSSLPPLASFTPRIFQYVG